MWATGGALEGTLCCDWGENQMLLSFQSTEVTRLFYCTLNIWIWSEVHFISAQARSLPSVSPCEATEVTASHCSRGYCYLHRHQPTQQSAQQMARREEKNWRRETGRTPSSFLWHFLSPRSGSLQSYSSDEIRLCQRGASLVADLFLK